MCPAAARVFALALWLLPATSGAYPVIVRATSRIELAMRPEGTRMALDGRLVRDDGSAIAGADVVLNVGALPSSLLQTAQDGRFGWSEELPFGEYDVAATFRGLDDVEGAVERRRFEHGRADVSLDLAAPAQIDRTRGAIELELRARSLAGGAGLVVELRDRQDHVLARGTTNDAGLARFSVSPRALGTPGPVRLEARSAADALRGPGHDVVDTMLVSRSVLTLDPPAARVKADGVLTVSGRVADEEHPIVRGAVEITVGRAPAVRTATDASGAFHAEVPFEGLPRGALELTVGYLPDASWRLPARVGPLRVEHLAPTPVPLWLLLVPVALTALALLLALRVSGDRRGAAARRARAQPPPSRVAGGLQAARPADARTRTAKKPPDAVIAGRVWDATTRRGIADATVRITFGGETHAFTCDAAGRFTTGPLAAGDGTVEAASGGYLSESFPARIPHHGELADVRIDLVPVRHRVMEIYRDAALRVLPERDLWGYWTPRELLRFVEKRREAREMPLAPLTALFEEVYYAGRGASLEHVARANELAGTVGARTPH